MTLGIVACSARKMPTPCPAWLMYSASPCFSQAFIAAKQDCDTVRILSGKYGLIDPSTIIAPYNQRINPDKPGLAEEIRQSVLSTGETEIISYCPSTYNKALHLIKFKHAAQGGLYEKAKAIGKRGSIKGNVFPISASLVWVYQNSGATLAEYRGFCCRQWKSPATRKAQFQRMLDSQFASIRDGRIYYAFQITHRQDIAHAE